MSLSSRPRGFTAVELMLLIAFVGVMSAVAWPRWKIMQREQNEAYATGSMRAIMSAQVDYHAVNAGFAQDLAALGKPCPGTAVPWLAPELARNGAVLDGYVFTTGPSGSAVQGVRDCNGSPTYNGYYASAQPVRPGDTGDRAFAGNNAGELWQSTNAVPPAEPFDVSPTTSKVVR